MMARLSKLTLLVPLAVFAVVSFLYLRMRFAVPAYKPEASMASASKPTAHPGDRNVSTVLPENAASMLAHPCSRSGPPRFEKTWLPRQADVQALESRLGRISSLLSGGLVRQRRISNPSRYYRQYVGIVVGDRKLIYLNAFCDKPEDVVVRQDGDWRQHPVDVCDGGDCFWSAVYDPLSGEFSDLQVNGVA
jgi:hypothetical protein